MHDAHSTLASVAMRVCALVCFITSRIVLIHHRRIALLTESTPSVVPSVAQSCFAAATSESPHAHHSRVVAMEWLRTPLVTEADAEAAAARQKAARPTSAAHRLLQLDLVRGLIMCIMAWGQMRTVHRVHTCRRRLARASDSRTPWPCVCCSSRYHQITVAI
jgi:hypothetical protein